VDFLTSITSGFRNYVMFRGRASCSEYWYWTLFVILLAIVTSLVDAVLFGVDVLDFDNTPPLNTIATLLTFLPSLAVSVRRLHDIDRTGWWVLIAFTGIGILVLLYWALQSGTWGPNRFGPNPLQGPLDQPLNS
jgi:uncharacterized membrane protein YhaH (DUF805 family)